MKLQIPAIGYTQGGRQMAVTAMNPISLVKTVAQPVEWKPLGKQPHGNRRIDKPHQAGIVKYLEEEEHFVIGAVVVYATPDAAHFRPSADWGSENGNADEPFAPGTLYLDVGAEFDIGDGQHRLGAYSDVIARHTERGDEVMDRLRDSGQPVIVVIDDNPLHRAQDFTDLQRNSKPLASSLGNSMDRRQAINRLLIELIEDDHLPIFGTGDGERVEFMSDTVSKNAAQLFSFKAIRYVSGLVLGVNDRTSKGWDRKVEAAVTADPAAAKAKLAAFWRGVGDLAPFTRLGERKADGKLYSAKDVRAESYLSAAGVLYAIGWAAHLAQTERDQDAAAFTEALAKVSFARPPRTPSETAPLTRQDTILAGSLVDPESGRIPGSQSAWEATAGVLLEHTA